ncbi:MAG TPA: hypothetical protein PLC98_19810 [Anaerolineales bacterium]|nr:hypothetical protein [Anaerolineales bacterium]
MSEPLDWQILDDDPAAEPEPPAPETSPPPVAPKRRWPAIGLGIAALAIAALSLPWLLANPREAQLEASVTTVAGMEPRLIPIPYAIRSASAFDVETVLQDTDGRIHATLSYASTLFDGTPLRFSLERDYVTVGTTLQRDEAQEHPTLATLANADDAGRIVIKALPVDHDFLGTEVEPYLEDLAQAACAVWSCPETARVTLNFSVLTPEPDHAEALEPVAGSWLLAGAVEARFLSSAQFPAPYLAGVPADEVTLDVYRRMLGLRVLHLLARSVAEPLGRPLPSSAQAISISALAARTAAHLGLEPAVVASALPAPDDVGLITGSPDRRATLAPRALLRLNAFLGEPGSPLERELWQAISAEPVDVVRLAVRLARRNDLPPAAAFELVIGQATARELLDALTRPDWSAQIQCQQAVHIYGADGARSITWDTQNAEQVLRLYPLSPDGALQPLILLNQPLFLRTSDGTLHWLTLPDDQEAGLQDLYWVGRRTLAGYTPELGIASVVVTVDDTAPGHLAFDVSLAATTDDPFSLPWHGADVFLRLADTTSENDGRVFRSMQVVDAAGSLIADWGNAAYPSLNLNTGEVAVLSLSEDSTGLPEYRLTIYASPTDRAGRVVWRSSQFGWTLRPEPAFAAAYWNTALNEVVGFMIPRAEAPGWQSQPLLWRVDPRTGAATELPLTNETASGGVWFSVSADGQYFALTGSSDDALQFHTEILTLSDGVVVRQLKQAAVGYLEWSLHGSALAIHSEDRVALFASPEEQEPFWEVGTRGCDRVIWRPAGR